MIFHDVIQNTDEWFALRAGNVGGSSIGKIMANMKPIAKSVPSCIIHIGKDQYDYTRPFGDPAKQLAVKLAIEQITGKTKEGESFSNSHMERGHEQEPIARAMYEREYFCTVTNGGFFDGEDGCGVSPDGMVSDNGMVEIKSVIDHVQYSTVKRDSYDPKYKWQLVLNMKVTGREWIDYVSFSAEFPEGKRLYVKRIWAKDCKDLFLLVDLRLNEYWKLLAETKKIIEAV